MTAPTIQLFVAHPADVAIDAQAVGADIQAQAKRDHLKVVGAALGRKGLRYQTGIGACTRSHVDIVEIGLGPRASYASPGELGVVLSELTSRIGKTPLLMWSGYLIGINEAAPGEARLPSVTQMSNFGPAQDPILDGGGFAITRAAPRSQSTALHETFHVLGAANPNAVHTVFDDDTHVEPVGDLMYTFSGDTIDIGQDDYFNPSGTIAGKNGQPVWNLYESFYLCHVGTCFQEQLAPEISLRAISQTKSSAQLVASGAETYRWYLDGSFVETWTGETVTAPLNHVVSVRGFTSDGAASQMQTLKTGAAPPSAGPTTPMGPAKMTVQRAGVRSGKIDVLARITARATGRASVSYVSSRRTTRFTAPIVNGRIRFTRTLPAKQQRKPTGIITLSYAGNSVVSADAVTLRAANGKAVLRREIARVDDDGRLIVSGSISRLARGVVRIRLSFVGPDGNIQAVGARAQIKNGTWTVSHALPSAAVRRGGQLSIQFTGYEPRLIRGEQLAKFVVGARVGE